MGTKYYLHGFRNIVKKSNKIVSWARDESVALWTRDESVALLYIPLVDDTVSELGLQKIIHSYL